jgi:signal transduction histidine kinase
LSWKFQGLVTQLPRGDRVRGEMEDALDVADLLIAEGRDSVEGLRAPRDRTELAAAIVAYAEQRATASSAALSCVAEQAPRALRDDAWQELFRIGCEACSNALRHAQATTVRVRIRYGETGLSLDISDDGVGFVVPAPTAGDPARRWGLVGMRERASRLGSTLLIESVPGVGTTVRLDVAANVAYAVLRPGWRGSRTGGG